MALKHIHSHANPAGYPSRALAAPEASPEDVAKAFKKKPFAAMLLLAHKRDPQSPIILAEDADLLAASPLLLEFALNSICTPTKPAHPVAGVVKKIDKALQPAFAAALERRLAANDWPETVGVVTLKNKPHLFLKRMPPPPPPPATLLATKLLDALHRLKHDGGYPTTLAHLLGQADPNATPDLVRQALKEKVFKLWLGSSSPWRTISTRRSPSSKTPANSPPVLCCSKPSSPRRAPRGIK